MKRGPPAIAEAIGLAAALDYLCALGLEKIHAWEQQLTQHLFDRLQAIDGLTIYGPAPRSSWIVGALASFTVAGAMPMTWPPFWTAPASAFAVATIAPNPCTRHFR